LESANQELKDFAYVVSHDLKAPLRGIKTLTDWITTDYADKLDDNGRQQISLLTSRVDRMHNLIDGILQYSRIGRVQEEKVQINLNEVVPEIIDTIAPPENITITIENELPTIKFEPTRITQVFQNLLSNAVKYMDKPKGRIKVDCVEEDGFWKFSVADNGPGIEEKHFERIFQMFQTLAPRDEFESTGVGLTVAKKIVELYKGEIWLESEVGQGSTFFFTLPKREVGAKDEKLEANIIS
jgi:light-regulated signal transduction histidine kinase (bacteriophytochrome)